MNLVLNLVKNIGFRYIFIMLDLRWVLEKIEIDGFLNRDRYYRLFYVLIDMF